MNRRLSLLLPLLAACAGAPPPQAPPSPIASVPVSVPSLVPTATATATPSESAPAPLSLADRAARLHRDAIVIDTHDDVTSAILEDGFDLAHPATGANRTATDLVK